MNPWHLLVHVTGSDAPGTPWNLFWSGFGSGPLAWCCLPLVYLRHHNCHEVWCIRLGRHQHPDGGKYCRKHHLLKQHPLKQYLSKKSKAPPR